MNAQRSQTAGGRASAQTKAESPHASPEAPRNLRRVVAADHPDRRLAQPATMTQMFLRFDQTHELPLLVETEDGKPIARFALAGDLAIFVSKDRQTLPAPFVLALANQ